MSDAAAPAAEAPLARPDRRPLIAFIADAPTEAALREGLIEAAPGGLDVRRGNVRAAIAALQKMPTPECLVVDVSGEEQPLTALGQLSEVVEPGARVLVIGELEDVNFYRHITRSLGALEYLYKPLTRDMVARLFGPLVMRAPPGSEGVLSGRVVTISGVRGGVGATTVAANLAWHFGVSARRHTVLLDADLHLGTAALLLGAKTGPGLRMALEAPQRIDALFVERAAQPVAERLHILAGEEAPHEHHACAPGAAQRLVEVLRQRYNFVLVDARFAALPVNRELLDIAHRRVLVMEPSVAGVRDALRFLAMPAGPKQSQRPVVVLNRIGRPGSLNRRQVEDALKLRPDVAIPDLPRLLGHAANMGEPAVGSRGAFRAGIVELAREVGFVGLLDASAGLRNRALLKEQSRRKGRLFGLFG
ncbi:MAG TPA: cellulose synthase operon protein YhjQ/BcsQ [Acetobacteraceae bacterium]|nr:cellulose synthase operon protein YhjQ/BcsQ [Acetobacteraceae bacterium]